MSVKFGQTYVLQGAARHLPQNMQQNASSYRVCTGAPSDRGSLFVSGEDVLVVTNSSSKLPAPKNDADFLADTAKRLGKENEEKIVKQLAYDLKQDVIGTGISGLTYDLS